MKTTSLNLSEEARQMLNAIMAHRNTHRMGETIRALIAQEFQRIFNPQS